ncbi:hypothetical protein Mgra_00001511 [Meloidogyne graminicola]|uniref:Uncharacterized protein n=1 Tax=Meloidogyne graminicola TaxID=189291 RepID=A0A8T0A0P7_9BILA|nr:hypothetical protein Mgra_00001511 [Meloidogyne graminicola]
MKIKVEINKINYLDKILKEFLIKQNINKINKEFIFISEQIDKIIEYYGQQIENIILFNKKKMLKEIDKNCIKIIFDKKPEYWLFYGRTDKNEFSINCNGNYINELNIKIEELINELKNKIPKNNEIKKEYLIIRGHYLLNKMGIKLFNQIKKIIGENEKELKNNLLNQIKISFNSILFENFVYAKTIAEEMFKLMNENGYELKKLKELIENSNNEIPDELNNEINFISFFNNKLIKENLIKQSTNIVNKLFNLILILIFIVK